MRFPFLPTKFSETNFESAMRVLNAVLLNITVENLQAQTLSFVIASGETLELTHSLKQVPRYRIILRQRGDGSLRDGDADWTDKTVYFKAVGGEVRATVLLWR